MNRRSFFHSLAAASTLSGIGAVQSLLLEQQSLGARGTITRQTHIAVVGAGAFGGWTALHLLRSGARVTLVDTWGPGNSRASSGGESRVIRYAYGDRRYVDMVARSFEIWEENEARWGRTLLHRPGVLFMGPESHSFGRDAEPHLRAAGVDYEMWGADDIARQYPQMNPDGLEWGIWEPTAGYLLAREGCRAVADAFVAEGGTFRVARAEPGANRQGEIDGIRLSDGSTVEADAYVFACGPWLGRVFPDVLGDLIRPTRQEVFYFGAPPGETAYREENFPVWADFGERVWYGIPGNEDRGFKVADDTRGPAFDPTSGERRATEDGLNAARAYLEHRFPGMRGAPLLESRVCQYEESPDSHFIIDRHPEAENVWLVGGGSGHGYKLGAALGEYVAGIVLNEAPPDPMFGLARFE